MDFPAPKQRKFPILSSTWADFPHSNDPSDFFELMWNQDILMYLRNRLNLQIVQQQHNKVTVEELSKFFGQLLTISITNVRNIKDLWKTGEHLMMYPGKECGLMRDRWWWILSHLNFEEKTVQMKVHKLFSSHIIPGTFVTVDESRIPSRDI